VPSIFATDNLLTMTGLADVERAFVHVDYEDTHDVNEEHKPLYGMIKPHRSLKVVLTDAKNGFVSMISPRRSSE
jgi:hypothetical protein